METIEAILDRRSIRHYGPEPVSDDLVRKCLEAAMYAPSARNTQPWHFVVVRQRKMLDQIARFHPFAKMLRQAPLAVAVCADTKIESSLEYNALNCAAATQNILLAAHALNLGSVWLGIYPRKQRMQDLSALLHLPEEIVPYTLVALGYAREKKPRPARYDVARIHFDIW